MPVFLVKSLLGILLLLIGLLSVFTMFEVFGRPEKRFDVQKLKRIHKINGFVFLGVFVVVSFLCLEFLHRTRGDLSPRSAIHSLVALAVLFLLGLKIAFVSFYKQFYAQAKLLGVLIAGLTFVLFGLSGGYYLLVTDFGFDLPRTPAVAGPAAGTAPGEGLPAPDPAAVDQGKRLFDSLCTGCHASLSERTTVGPGLAGLLKKAELPISRRPATPENIARQLRTPFRSMPPFPALTEAEVKALISYLGTL